MVSPRLLNPVNFDSLKVEALSISTITSPLTLQDQGSTINLCGPDENCVPLPILIFVIVLILMWSFEAFNKSERGWGFFSLVWLMVIGILLVLLL